MGRYRSSRRGGYGQQAERYLAGRDVLRLLMSAAKAVNAQGAEGQKELQRLEAAARDDLRSRGEQLERLAEHYLPAVNREAVGATFLEVRGELQEILRRKQRHEEDLQRQWDAALDKRQRLQADLDGVTGELDALVDRREELEDRLAERLDEDDLFQDLSRRALQAEQQLQRDLARVEESRREAAEKLPDYEQSRLFQYLVKRGFGTPEYERRGLTRRLDRWVAKLVKFDKAKRSYDFLRATPELMAAEVDRRRDEFDELMGRVEAIEEEHSAEIGLTDVLKEGMKTGKRRDALLTKIEAEQEDQDGIERRLAGLAGSDNDFYRQAVERMRRFLDGLNESALEAKTRGTAERADDAIFDEIRWINGRLDDARRQADDLRRRQSGLQRQRNDLADLARRFQIAEYDSQRSVFPDGFDPRPDIERLVKGEIGKEELWSAIKRHQEFLPTWVERQTHNNRDLIDSEFSYVLMRVLAEAAGAAIRHAADGHRRGRRIGRPPSVRRRARGGFTGGIGF